MVAQAIFCLLARYSQASGHFFHLKLRSKRTLGSAFYFMPKGRGYDQQRQCYLVCLLLSGPPDAAAKIRTACPPRIPSPTCDKLPSSQGCHTPLPMALAGSYHASILCNFLCVQIIILHCLYTVHVASNTFTIIIYP